MMSVEMPSAIYSCSESLDELTKGKMAIDGLRAWNGACSSVPEVRRAAQRHYFAIHSDQCRA